MDRKTEAKAFAEALQDSAAIYGRAKLTASAIELYWRVLERYPLTDVLEGLSRHLADPDAGQFMPKPADVIRNIDGSNDSQAMRAWTKAHKAAGRVGNYQTVVFDDWRIMAVIGDMGGWIAFCAITEDEAPFKAREFEKRYRGYRDQRTDFPNKLIGRAEAHNSGEGHEVDPPVLIGDQDRARLVFERGSGEAKRLEIGTLLPRISAKKCEVST